MTLLNRLILALTCAMAVTACGGSPTAPSVPNTGSTVLSSVDGLAGTPDQPFTRRVAQTSYPSESLLLNPAAMKRILGEDRDNNGIRDDVDAFLVNLTTDLVELRAYQQYAKVLQSRFLVSTKQEAYANIDLNVKALKCFDKLSKEKSNKFSKNAKQLISILKLTVNTFERTIRGDEVNSLAHGHTASFKTNEDLSGVCLP